MNKQTILNTAIILMMIHVNAFAAQIVPLPTVSLTKAEGVFINTTPDQAVLVTSTGIATLTANGDTVVIEQGGSAIITGDHEKVYVKNGGNLIITGSGNTVYYENGSKITATGEGSQSIQVILSRLLTAIFQSNLEYLREFWVVFTFGPNKTFS